MSQRIPFALLNIQVSQLNQGFVRCVFFCMIIQIWNVFDMKTFFRVGSSWLKKQENQ